MENPPTTPTTPDFIDDIAVNPEVEVLRGRRARESRLAWHVAIGPQEVHDLAVKVLEEAKKSCNPALVKLIMQQAMGSPEAEDVLEEVERVREMLKGLRGD